VIDKDTIMIKKIAHLADIHIRRATDRHFEYEQVFQRLYEMLRADAPDRIVIVGDLYNDYIEFQGEAMTLAGRFLNNLSEIAQVRITRGNHDIRKKNLNRQDFIKTIIELLNNDKVVYYDESGVYEDENVSWCVWHHPDKTGPNTDKAKGLKIDLFHDPIYSSVSVNGYRMDKEHYLKLDAFSGDLGLFGDIHKRQYFSSFKKAYPGSLIQQNYEEPLKDHGYLLWDTSDLSVVERDVPNDFGFHTLNLGPGTDFDNLYTEEQFSKMPKIRVKWVDSRANINKVNEIKIREFLQQFQPIEVRIEKEALNISMTAVANTQIEDIDDVVVQQEIFTEYLKQQEYKDEQIAQILLIDNEINKLMEQKESKGYSWKLKQLWLDNYRSYGDNACCK
jgi:DNA repair exonuclease SbcCD nuclease subunit